MSRARTRPGGPSPAAPPTPCGGGSGGRTARAEPHLAESPRRGRGLTPPYRPHQHRPPPRGSQEGAGLHPSGALRRGRGLTLRRLPGGAEPNLPPHPGAYTQGWGPPFTRAADPECQCLDLARSPGRGPAGLLPLGAGQRWHLLLLCSLEASGTCHFVLRLVVVAVRPISAGVDRPHSCFLPVKTTEP